MIGVGADVLVWQVRIGENVRILNSYIWDDVEVGDGCVINGAVICNSARLGSVAVLRTIGFALWINGVGFLSQPCADQVPRLGEFWHLSHSKTNLFAQCVLFPGPDA